MRISDCSSDVCSSDLEFRVTVLSGIEFSHIFSRVFDLLRDYQLALPPDLAILLRTLLTAEGFARSFAPDYNIGEETRPIMLELFAERFSLGRNRANLKKVRRQLLALAAIRSEEHTSELQSLMRN